MKNERLFLFKIFFYMNFFSKYFNLISKNIILFQKKMNKNSFILDKSFEKNIEENYEQLEILNTSDNSAVFRVKSKETKIEYANKMFLLEENTSDIIMDNIKKEIFILSKCNHINLMKFFGYEIKKNKINILLELMKNDLSNVEFHESQKGFIFQIFYSISNAIFYLKNELNLMHCDIKPSNIFIDFNGNIKLGDFGSVKKISTEFYNQEGEIVGFFIVIYN